MQDQNVSDIRDALKNVAGVTFRAGEGGNQGDTPYIRGFSSPLRTICSATVSAIRAGTRRDAFPIDAVEVYKGPSAVLFGRGSTGGAINLVSKLPQDRTFVEERLPVYRSRLAHDPRRQWPIQRQTLIPHRDHGTGV